MTEVFVGIGSNVQPRRHIAAALSALAAEFGELKRSPVYQNPAVGFEGDDFLNLVVGFSTQLEVTELVDVLHDVERRCGRQRSEQRWGPRTLDLDLLLFGKRVSSRPTLPRPDVLKRAFVLLPLAELAPAARHPVLGLTYAEIWAAFDGDNGGLHAVPWPEPGATDESNGMTDDGGEERVEKS